jgi:hypothetical protein
MSRPKCLQIALLVFTGVLTAQNSAHAQDTVIAGLKGKVQTILTEEFTSKDLAGREPSGSTLDVYDPAGYILESFRYKPDGSLWEQVVYYRNGPQVLRVDVTGTYPYESHSEQNTYDSEGHQVEYDIYDANGVLVSKTTNVFSQHPNSDIMYQRIETIKGAKTTTVTTKIAETTDPQTGITHQVTTKNGQIDLDWVIQQNPDGTVKNEKAVQPDGSYTESERKPDGTTLGDQYNAAAKMHNYTKLDAKGHIVESLEKSSSYYIRCTYSFDKAGRQTGQINYGISGNILDKSTSEYRDDSHGNWIEKKNIVWNTKTQPVQPKILKLTLRTINYY